jgi:hypothetical protein
LILIARDRHWAIDSSRTGPVKGRRYARAANRRIGANQAAAGEYTAASTTKQAGAIMANSGKAPTLVVWVISLVLYVVALASAFGVVSIAAPVAMWCWIIGFGLLLIACRVRGL